MKDTIVHILIEVALIQVWPLGADEEQVFFPTSMEEELAGPNLNIGGKGISFVLLSLSLYGDTS